MGSSHYRVHLAPNTHQLMVEASFEGFPPGTVHLELPTWVPGAYGFMKYGRDLFRIVAQDPLTGSVLPVEREGWSGFRTHTERGGLKLSYQVAAFDPAWGELVGYVDQDHAVLLGTHYLYVRGLETSPCRVDYVLPEDWDLHHPAGGREFGERSFQYESYPRLLDTPVVAGAFRRETRTAHGVKFHHVFVDEALGMDVGMEGFVDALMRVAESHHAMFGSFPFDSYTYVFSCNPTAHWGLEHANATMIGLGDDVFIDAAARARAVRVCAHELFHAWNVCRLKPAPLVRPDHAKGAFTDALWIAEGVTRYYEFLFSVRAKELSGDAFFSNVLNYCRHLSAQPAFAHVTAVDSSRATFLNHNKYPGSINATIDYYDAGMLIAFDLDVALRAAGSSLDEAFRRFYDEFAAAPEGYSHSDFARFIERRWPRAVDAVRAAEKPAASRTRESLEQLGFALRSHKVRTLGLVLTQNAGPEIANVLDGTAAGESGLAAGDVIQAVMGYPFSLKALRWAVKNEPIVVLDVRRGNRSFHYELSPREREELFELTWNGTPEQARAVQDLLGRPDFELPAGKAVPLDAFENFHGIQAVL